MGAQPGSPSSGCDAVGATGITCVTYVTCVTQSRSHAEDVRGSYRRIETDVIALTPAKALSGQFVGDAEARCRVQPQGLGIDPDSSLTRIVCVQVNHDENDVCSRLSRPAVGFRPRVLGVAQDVAPVAVMEPQIPQGM